MLSLQEQMQVASDFDTFESQFTDDVIDAAESYSIDEDPITLEIKVTLYDINGAALANAVVEDYDTAVVYLEEFFDLEELEDYDQIDADAAAGGSRYGHNAASGSSGI